MKRASIFLLFFLLVAATTFAQKDKSDKGTADQQAMQQAMAAMMGGQNCDIAASYAFDHDFDMNMTMVDKKGKEASRMTMRCYLSNDGKRFGYLLLSSSEKKTPSAKMVMDMTTKKMITLIDQEGRKMAMCMDLNSPLFQSDRQVDDPVQKMKKTGRTKTIQGYLCEEYQSVTEEATSSYWVSKKTSIPMGKYYKAMSSMKTTPFGGGQDLPTDGMMMQMESVSKNGEKTKLEVTAIHPNHTSSISTAGYQKF